MMFIFACSMTVGLLVIIVIEAVTDKGIGLGGILAMVAIGAFVILFYSLGFWQPTVRQLHRVESYDTSSFNRFKRALDGVSVGLGIEPPALIVMDSPFPDSCVTTVGGKAAVVVSPQLLAMDLTDQEVEAVMATGAVKAAYDRMARSWPDELDKMEVPHDITRRARDRAWDEKRSSYCSFVLQTDTLAARLTSEPAALRSAITKVRKVAMREPQRFAYVPSDRFVDPPMIGRHKRENRMFEELNSLRLENLERIEAGERQAFSQLCEGRPIVRPEGWR